MYVVLISGFGGMYMGGMPGMGMDGGELLHWRTYSHTIINVLVFLKHILVNFF